MHPTSTADRRSPTAGRRILHRTSGYGHGITRLMSPGDLGEVVKPFVFLDHFETEGRGMTEFPWHPHSGIATHTTLLEGDVGYADSSGESGRLTAGSVEYMMAGRGVWHTGSLPPGRRVRGFQLWLALPDQDELGPAQSHYLEPSRIPEVDGVRVLLGTYGGARSVIPYGAPITYLHLSLKDGARWRYEPPTGHDVAWLAVSAGELAVAGATVRRELVVFEDGDAPIDVQASPDAEFVIGSAARHPSPLVLGSYSVHSSHDRLRQGQAGIREVADRIRHQHALVNFRG